jgi:hypothetical protein
MVLAWSAEQSSAFALGHSWVTEGDYACDSPSWFKECGGFGIVGGKGQVEVGKGLTG